LACCGICSPASSIKSSTSLSVLILEYNERLNQQDTTFWSVKDVIDFLLRGDDDTNFSDYAKLHIGRMINRNQDRTARNYKLAVAHLERFLGTTRVLFSYLTSPVIQKWILTLEKTHRAKEMYPICIRQIFKAALIELNDEEKGIVRIKYNPWLKVKIPHADVAPQIAISAEECREFFNRPLPQTKYTHPYRVGPRCCFARALFSRHEYR
jgi:hypothetical protein